MTNIPNPSPRDESTDHIPETDTGSDTPRHPFGMTPSAWLLDYENEFDAAIYGELDYLQQCNPWLTKVVVVRYESCECCSPGYDSGCSYPTLQTFLDEVDNSEWPAVGLETRLTELRVIMHGPEYAAFIVPTNAEAEAMLWLFEGKHSGMHPGLTIELRDLRNLSATDELLEAALPFLQNKDRRIRALSRAYDDEVTERREVDAALNELHLWTAERLGELNTANDHNDELKAVIQRQGGRVDREHAGLTAQVTRLTTELDNANLYNNELRAIIAGRSNQVETELDEALVWGTAYRTKVAALTAELGEAVALLEVVSAEADSYAGRLKALRGAA